MLVNILICSLSFLVSCGSKNSSENLSFTNETTSTNQIVPQTTSTQSETIYQERASSEKTNYYYSIKASWQEQTDYIESLEDPYIKHSVQTPKSAATAEATKLQRQYPDDVQQIEEALKQVLSGK
ncbi:hypothetical protein [Candidatus Enterococcus courvalinii]|uniref:Lipoprotein n=1 Tax=Candidatus Enterococcus courvalinii TaxID=2815329 RepID=A0ABS3I020_9ENTE|nr:hypothetical protein [Enterococcus sp. MSG2901]MBO0482016.1 hypothetical protein [Enterococcus sp. MSG2901]